MQLTYRGRARPAGTHLYAQIVDTEADEVVGGQATPLPVILDGRVRTVERPLQSIALRASGASLYRLQIIAGTAAYQVQGSKGRVSIYGAFGSLPLVDATRSGRGLLPRTPKRARIAVTARRDGRDGRFTRVRVRVRQPSGPCSGSVTFVVETDRRPYMSNAPLETDPCRAVTLRRLRLRKRSQRPRDRDVQRKREAQAALRGAGHVSRRSDGLRRRAGGAGRAGLRAAFAGSGWARPPAVRMRLGTASLREEGSFAAVLCGGRTRRAGGGLGMEK